MARDEVEYSKLVELRNALYDKANAEKAINETNKRINSLKPKTIEEPELKECTRNVDALRRRFEEPYNQEAIRKAKAQAQIAESRKKIWVALSFFIDRIPFGIT